MALAAIVGLSGAGLAPACASPESLLASFIDVPFADAVAEVHALDGPALEPIMDELLERFRTYLDLREALPFQDLMVSECMSDFRDTGDTLRFRLDLACAYGDLYEPAAGSLLLEQRLVASDPDVTELTADYEDVVLGELEVDGVEEVTETAGDNGASVRTIDVVQNGLELAYDFRIGVVDGDQVVIDYKLDAPGGLLLARVSSPTTPGAQASVVLTGIDGSVTCEIRATPWSPGAHAKGVCDNGQTFGLPVSDL